MYLMVLSLRIEMSVAFQCIIGTKHTRKERQRGLESVSEKLMRNLKDSDKSVMTKDSMKSTFSVKMAAVKSEYKLQFTI